MSEPAYDWTWRKKQPMLFQHIFREAVEVCSPELYLRWITAKIYIDELYWYGLLPDFLDIHDRRDVAIAWQRLIAIELVRAYLRERRAGVLPRKPGPPPETSERINMVREHIQRLSEAAEEARRQEQLRERERHQQMQWKMFATAWLTIGVPL